MLQTGLRCLAGLAAALVLALPVAAQQAPGAPLPRAEMWMLLPLFEANRPVITERKLSGAEKSEAKKLSKMYLGSRATGAVRTMAALARMRELASSGDRDAMIAIRDALVTGIAPNDYIAKFDPQNSDSQFFEELAKVQSAQWTAQVWSRYGYEDAGRESISACVRGMYGDVYRHKKDGVLSYVSDGKVVSVNPNRRAEDSPLDSCGFELTGGVAFGRNENGSPKRLAPNGAFLIPSYDATGWGGLDHGAAIYITGAVFGPIYGDKDFLEAKFQRQLEARRKSLYNGLSAPWYERYAMDNNKMAQLDAIDAEVAGQALRDKEEERKMWVRNFEDAKAGVGGLGADTNYYNMQVAAINLGGDYQKEFDKMPKPEWATRFDSTSSPSSPVGGSTDPNARVEVRTYNGTGNYTGSIYTSPFWASVINMTSASH